MHEHTQQQQAEGHVPSTLSCCMLPTSLSTHTEAPPIQLRQHPVLQWLGVSRCNSGGSSHLHVEGLQPYIYWSSKKGAVSCQACSCRGMCKQSCSETTAAVDNTGASHGHANTRAAAHTCSGVLGQPSRADMRSTACKHGGCPPTRTDVPAIFVGWQAPHMNSVHSCVCYV